MKLPQRDNPREFVLEGWHNIESVEHHPQPCGDMIPVDGGINRVRAAMQDQDAAGWSV